MKRAVPEEQTSLPFARGSHTSRAAAESMVSPAATYRGQVLAFIRDRGDYGATADEVQVTLGLTHQNCSARVSELASKFKVIVPSGRMRPTRSGRNAVVYVMR